MPVSKKSTWHKIVTKRSYFARRKQIATTSDVKQSAQSCKRRLDPRMSYSLLLISFFNSIKTLLPFPFFRILKSGLMLGHMFYYREESSINLLLLKRKS